MKVRHLNEIQERIKNLDNARRDIGHFWIYPFSEKWKEANDAITEKIDRLKSIEIATIEEKEKSN